METAKSAESAVNARCPSHTKSQPTSILDGLGFRVDPSSGANLGEMSSVLSLRPVNKKVTSQPDDRVCVDASKREIARS